MGRVLTGARRTALPALGAGGWLTPLLLVALLGLLLLANLGGLRLVAARPYHIDAGGYGDQLLLRGFFAAEENAAGDTYRWTGRNSRLQIRGAALSPALILALVVGGTPDGAPAPLPLSLTINDAPWGPVHVGSTPRRYLLLVPSDGNAGVTLGFSSPLTSSPADPRPVGLRLDGVDLRLRPGWLLPSPIHLLAQAICLLLLAVTLHPLRLPRLWFVGALALAAVALGAVEASALPMMELYLPRLVGIGLTVAAGTWLGLPAVRRALPDIGEQNVRWLWGILLVSVLVRMAGALYPPFAPHDISLNLRRLDAVGRGTLILVAGSAEFADQQTIYPPAPYVALLPTYLLVGSRELTLLFGLSLLDGATALLVGVLAYRLRLGSTTARIAAICYACSALSFTALWWGFTAQVFGQWTTVPLALALLAACERPHWRPWLAAALFFQIGLLSHAGVAVLSVVWVSLALGLYALFARPSLGWWRGAAAFYIGSGLAAVGLLYGDVVLLMLRGTQQAGSSVSGEVWRGATGLFVQGLLRAYSPAGLALVLVGVVLLLWMGRDRAAPLAVLGGWLATTLIFITVDLAYGLIVRHFYFALPLACVAAALSLSHAAAWKPWMRPVVWLLVAAYCVSGVLLWVAATAAYAKPSMTPLTH